MDIGEVAKATGLPPSTLRYYEERGLIRPCGRNGLRRVYQRSVLDKLALIALGRRAGFSLDEIAEMQAQSEGGIDRERLLQKAAEIDASIKELCAIRDGLRHAAACKAPSHNECNTFQRLLKLATKQQQKTRGRN